MHFKTSIQALKIAFDVWVLKCHMYLFKFSIPKNTDKGRIANVTNSIICLHQCSTKGKRWPMHWMFDLLWSQVMRKSPFSGFLFCLFEPLHVLATGKIPWYGRHPNWHCLSGAPKADWISGQCLLFYCSRTPKKVWSEKRQISKRQTPVRLLSLPWQALTLRSRQTGGQLHKQSYVTHTFSSRGLSWCCTWQTCFHFFFKKRILA